MIWVYSLACQGIHTAVGKLISFIPAKGDMNIILPQGNV